MKKTLTALAVLGAFAGSAFAANVTLYGIIDYGFNYTHTDNGTTTSHSFSLDSGIQSGSRFGLKGVEEIGNGVKVGFVLENGFKADAGTLDQDGRIFGRESLLYIETPYGEIGAGHTGMATGSIGRYSLYGKASAFSTSFGGATGALTQYHTSAGNNDNTIALRSPKFAGFQVQAEYSFKKDGVKASTDYEDTKGVENTASSDRAYGAAITYAGGPLWGFLSVEAINYASNGATYAGTVGDDEETTVQKRSDDDALLITLGGNYDFGVAKLFASAQYFDNARASLFGNAALLGLADPNYVKGYGVQVSTTIPAAGGTILAGVGYLDGELTDDAVNIDNKNEFTRWGVHGGYKYAISKRTDFYGVVGYEKDKYNKGNEDVKPESYKAVLGVRHSF